ncbi:dTDP-glucose 4,6-dehydratase [Candidatus Peregrinibacteria bacterium]|nr:dTDP-glucose 4,6-dehydratase [Candidatus Peregrinibacteria bacterium]MBI3816621.1 dTDP-glucose 4,6-dehydratase [Candidatus Peregrinibacteria bacterium]
MSLLVTGAAGFIGSHFVLRHCSGQVLRHCERHPDDAIVVLDKLTYAADRSFLDSVMDRIVFVQGDIADTPLVSSLVQQHGIETMVNFAAETHVDRSIEDEHPFLQTNVLGVQSLIDVCKAHPTARLLHISTDEVYGDIDDDDPPRAVGDPLFPSSPYAASKAAAEMLIIAAMRTYGIKAAVTRCTNNYGPHQFSEKFIPTVIRCALKDEPVPVYAEGKNKRDWLYVTDHCDALEAVLTTPWAFWDDTIQSGHFFNISADDERQNIDVAKAVLKVLGKPESLIHFVPDRPGHDWRYALDSSSIRKLGWKPQVSFEEGLRRTVEWFVRRG